MEDGLSWIGAPAELVRVLDSVYLDQARHSFATYVYQTLAAGQRHGGRFNPRGEFGALYTATDEETAWAEVAARFRREGIDGLPQDMGVLRIVVKMLAACARSARTRGRAGGFRHRGPTVTTSRCTPTGQTAS